VKARDPAIVDLGKEDLHRSQRSDQEGEGKAAEFDPRDEGGEEDKNREAVRKAESQVFVQVERRSAENRETGRQYLHDHSEEEQPRQEDERPACVAADRSHGGAS
jgi:hypothetical protein